MTVEIKQKLQDELDYLRSAKRQEVANRLHEAMEGGELIENAEYEAAKNEQAFVEGRILTLETLLNNAVVIKGDGPLGQVHLGSTVTVQEEGGNPEKYQMVGAAEADPREGRISNESPLGKALMGRKVGDEIKVNAPAGMLTFTIMDID